MISETKLRLAIRAALLREMKTGHSSAQYSAGGPYGEVPRFSASEPLVANPIAAIEKLFSNLSYFPTLRDSLSKAPDSELLLLIKLILGYSPNTPNVFDETAKSMIADMKNSLKASNRK